jgi:hypothetical protein
MSAIPYSAAFNGTISASGGRQNRPQAVISSRRFASASPRRYALR